MTLTSNVDRPGRPLNNEESPWGSGPDRGSGGGGPRNPWTRPSGGGSEPPGGGPGGPNFLDQLIERLRGRLPGGGPGGMEAGTVAIYVVGVVVALWLATSCVHRVGPQERGIVTFLGKFSRTLTPGISLTLPAPIERVKTVDVEEIRTIDIGSSGESARMVLTGDQNIIDLTYSVRWNIRSPELYAFQLADPEQTIQEVAESAMRAAIATVTLDEALGAGRTALEDQVRQRMQDILDGYRSGISVQGVAIKQADPPAAVNEAFKDVSAAQSDANAYVNKANAYKQQEIAKAQGEAAAFDKVYAQYRLAPEVTRRRMYYDTMEQVLSGVDKTIVETGGVTPYLPLPEIKRRARAAEPTEAQP